MSPEQIADSLRKKITVRGKEWDYEEWLRRNVDLGDGDIGQDGELVRAADTIRDLRLALASQIDITNTERAAKERAEALLVEQQFKSEPSVSHERLAKLEDALLQARAQFLIADDNPHRATPWIVRVIDAAMANTPPKPSGEIVAVDEGKPGGDKTVKVHSHVDWYGRRVIDRVEEIEPPSERTEP